MAQAQPTRSSSPVIVRAMAATLYDADVDLFNNAAVAIELIRAGFPSKLVEHYFDAARKMALIRRTNDARHGVR
jgi:hypothetical protein